MPIDHTSSSYPPLSGDGRDRILQAATALFAKRGYFGVSISDVAEAAGLVKSAIYHHFASKEALYLSVLDATCRESREQMAEGAQGESWRVRLDGAVFVLARLLGPGSHVLNLLFQGIAETFSEAMPGERAAIHRLRREFTRVLSQEISNGVHAGDLKPVDPELASVCLVGLVAAALQSGSATSEKGRIEFALDLFVHGMARSSRAVTPRQ